MSTGVYREPLTKRQQDICAYGGIFGILISITCFIQLMVVGTSHWMVTVLLLIYLVAATAFAVLAAQHPAAAVLLIISGVLAMAAEVIWIRSGVFSLVVLLLFLYNGVAIVFVFTEQVPARLRQKRRELKAEKELWEGKL